MELSEQGAFVDVYKRTKLFVKAFSRDSQGVRLSGHGKFQKHPLTDTDASIGASVRHCIHDRKPGHYVPHMYKEREAYLAWYKAYIEDRGIKSDKDFNKNTLSFQIRLFDDRIEYAVYNDDPNGRPFITLPLTASDEELGHALRQTYEYLLTQDQ